VDLVGEADCLSSGVEMLRRARPEVLFLDVELGRESGFQLLNVPERPARVVFTTLHPHYAVEAFDVQAADYLVKPVLAERLGRTLERLSNPEPEAGPAKQAVPGKRLEIDDLVVFKQGVERRVIPVGKIAWISGDRDYTRVVTADGKEYLDARRMREWQQILPPKQFHPIDRSTIVNLNEIASYRPMPCGGRIAIRNASVELTIGSVAYRRLESCFGSVMAG